MSISNRGKSVLALDAARTTGWAYSDGMGGMSSSVIRFGDSSKLKVPEFLCDFHDWLYRKALDLEPDYVAIEQSHMRGANTYYLISLYGITQMVTHRLNLPAPPFIHTASIKSHALGKGPKAAEALKRAIAEMSAEGASASKIKTEHSKRAMLTAARERWPQVRDDNEADALFLASLIRSRLDAGEDPNGKPAPKKKKKTRK